MPPEKRERAAHAAFLTAGALSIAVGTLVLLCWSLGFSLCRVLFPQSAPMMPNAALGFILLGLAALTPADSSARRLGAARAAALSAGAIGAATLGESLLGVAGGFDQLLVRAPIPPAGVPFPGRMAPDTALCLILLGAALWLKTLAGGSEIKSSASVILSLLAAAMGLTSLVLTPILGIPGWFGLTSMSLATSALFALLGLASGADSIQRDEQAWPLGGLGTAAFVSGLMVVVALGLSLSGRAARVARLNERAVARDRVLRATSRLISDEGYAEANAHGYLLTGDASLLQAYRSAGSDCAADLLRLRALTENDPERRRRTEELSSLLSGLLGWWRQAVAARRPGPISPAAVRAVAAHDRDSIAALAGLLARTQLEENALSGARRRETERLAETTDLLASAGTACGVAALVAGLILFNGILLKRRRAIEALRQNEEKYRGLFECEADAVVIIDQATHEIQDVNTAALRLYGYSKDEFLRLHIEDISANPERTREGVDRTNAPGNVAGVHRAKSGREFPVDIATARCRLEGRWMAIGVVRDLTERRQKEELLEQSESRLRALFESSRDALMISTYPDIHFTAANAAAVAMFRAKDVADFLARTPVDVSPERQPDGRASAEAAREHIEAAVRDGSRRFEWVHKRLDGEEFPADVLLTCVVSGGRTTVQGTVRDLTESRRAAAELRMLATAIEQTSESVVVTDAAARILYVNPAFERVTGYSRAEALGAKPSLLKSGRHDKSFYEELWATLVRGEVWRGRVFNRRKDGTIFEEDCSIAPVRAAGGPVTHYIAVKRDVSKERALEAQFLHSQRMEAVGRLAGGVAHDFNNILTAIIGSAQLLAPAVAGDRQATEDAATIVESGRRAAALTRQLLTFSRRQLVENAVFDLNSSVVNIQRMLKRTLGEDVRLEVVPSARPLWIDADACQIDQVLLNLAVNARDAMPQGGRLTVSTSALELTAARVSTYASAPPGLYACLRCADTGTGMSDEVLAHLFEPFFTTKEKGKGTGLGLSTVYGIVKRGGGHLFVDSAPGRGTAFEILLPLAAPPAAGGEDAPAAAPAACSETILVAEDEEAVLSMVQRTLKSQGYTVLPCRGGAEALEVSAAHRGRVDLLLTDVIMPGMGGPDLARRVAEDRPGTRVLYMSGYPDGRLDDGGALSPGLDLLQKPFQLSELCARVRRALDAAGQGRGLKERRDPPPPPA